MKLMIFILTFIINKHNIDSSKDQSFHMALTQDRILTMDNIFDKGSLTLFSVIFVASLKQ